MLFAIVTGLFAVFFLGVAVGIVAGTHLTLRERQRREAAGRST